MLTVFIFFLYFYVPNHCVWLIFPSKNDTMNLGYEELGCYQKLGYNEQIFWSNWSYLYSNQYIYKKPRL